MEKISKQVENAIKEALKLEINGRKFFNHAAGVTHHERGKKMFLHLASEEVKHLETFGKLFSQALQDRDWKKFIRDEELKGEAPLVEKLRASVRREGGQGEVEALRIGMELEQTAIGFFTKAAAETGDPTAAEIFRAIGEEEKFHYDLLEAQYDSVTHSGFWLGSAEFQMDGKW